MLETRIQRNVAGEIALALSDPSLKNAFLFPIAVSTLCHDGLLLPIAVLVLTVQPRVLGYGHWLQRYVQPGNARHFLHQLREQLYQYFKFYIYCK